MNATTNQFTNKETKLLDKISKAKQKLNKLKQKQKLDLGDLVIQYGLDKYNMEVLSDGFARLSEELSHDD